jgi:hypothetical protein
MFIEKQNIVEIGDVVTVKLVSGEELIGRLSETGVDSVALSKPVMIQLQPVGQNQMGLSFLPVLGSVEPDTQLQISKSALAIKPVKTGKTIASSYIETTSGIITPRTGGLIS